MSSVGQPQAETIGLPGLSGNFGQEVHDRCARCDVYEVFGSLREITSGDKVMNGLNDGGLINGSQILVNPPVKGGVTQLSVGFITV